MQPRDHVVQASLQFVTELLSAGHRVIINRLGDCIVRPSPLEASLRQIPAGKCGTCPR